ncbi:MAG: hypothetical protein U5R06_04565 [candidate division KSB1 bacterium]|nr:hypothetical protein [candidate division KSB1 bacterium]
MSAFNLADTNVYNKTFESIRDKRPQKAKQQMWSQLIEEEEELDITVENIQYLERGDGTFLTFVHDDPLISCRFVDGFSAQYSPAVSQNKID